MMQITADGMEIRFVCGLACDECFEDNITEGTYLQCAVVGDGSSSIVQSIPLLDVVEEQGPITWLHDGAMSVRTVDEGVRINAYSLYPVSYMVGMEWCVADIVR